MFNVALAHHDYFQDTVYVIETNVTNVTFPYKTLILVRFNV